MSTRPERASERRPLKSIAVPAANPSCNASSTNVSASARRRRIYDWAGRPCPGRRAAPRRPIVFPSLGRPSVRPSRPPTRLNMAVVYLCVGPSEGTGLDGGVVMEARIVDSSRRRTTDGRTDGDRPDRVKHSSVIVTTNSTPLCAITELASAGLLWPPFTIGLFFRPVQK